MDYNKKVRIHMPDGVEVEGVISKLEKHFIEVSITHPFVNWRNELIISGYAKMNPNDFLKRYKEVSEQLLRESYLTLKRLDDSIDRYAKLYQDLLEEKKLLESISKSEVRDRIERKSIDWFFDQFYFVGITQREKFQAILKAYIDHRLKIYMW